MAGREKATCQEPGVPGGPERIQSSSLGASKSLGV